MRAQRLKTGFHRIGVVIAVLCVIAAIGFFAYGIFVLVTPRLAGARPEDPLAAAILGAGCIIAAAAFYALFRGLGWIVAGFLGDGERN